MQDREKKRTKAFRGLRTAVRFVIRTLRTSPTGRRVSLAPAKPILSLLRGARGMVGLSIVSPRGPLRVSQEEPIMDAKAVILANAESPPSHRLIGFLCKGTPCHTSQAGGARYLGSGLVSFSLIDSWWAATFCLSPAVRGGGCFLQSSTVPSRNCARPREECGSFRGRLWLLGGSVVVV